jgi:hypothetical protein
MRKSLIILACLALSLAIVKFHLKQMPPKYLATEQLARHKGVMDGTIISPWRYRVWPEIVNAALLKVTWPERAFIVHRVVITFAAVLLAFLYFTKMGIDPWIGLSLFTFAGILSNNQGDLAFNQWWEMCFYLGIANLLVRYGRDNLTAWICVFIMMFGVTNRETLIFASALIFFFNAEAGIMGFLGAGFVLMLLYSSNITGPHLGSYGDRHFNINALEWLAITFGVIPFLAVARLKSSTPFLRYAFFWFAVPWVVFYLAIPVHLCETVKFMVPFTLVCIPIIMEAKGENHHAVV